MRRSTAVIAFARGVSVSKILKTESERKIFGADGGDHRLEIVPAFPGDTNHFSLDLRGDLDSELTHEGRHLLGHGRLDALLDFDHLPGVAEWRNVGFSTVDIFGTDPALGQFSDHHVHERFHSERVLRGQFDFVFFKKDFRRAVFEIKPSGQFFARLIDGIFNFHGVNLGNNVEGGHSILIGLVVVKRSPDPAAESTPTFDVTVGLEPFDGVGESGAWRGLRETEFPDGFGRVKEHFVACHPNPGDRGTRRFSSD